MEKSDVIKAREFLRVTYNKRVWDPETEEYKIVEDMLPLAVEFDNSLACSEEVDPVFWDDENGFVVFFNYNNTNVRGAQPIMGTDKPLNPAVCHVVDYGEIQQFRMVVNKEGFNAIMQKIKNGNFKVNYHGAETDVTDDIIKNAERVLFTAMDPATVIEKNKKLGYK